MAKRVVIIGAGFGGMSTAAYLAHAGYEVIVCEKNDQPGGRAMVVSKDGFTWDLGPSWYMMPDVFEEFFHDLGKDVRDYYKLVPLEPSYRVFDEAGEMAVHDAAQTAETFEAISPGSGKQLLRLLDKTGSEYHRVRKHILTTNWLKLRQTLQPEVLRFLLNPDMVRSYDHRVSKYIRAPRLKRILEFMTVFMGGSPRNIPGMYTLLTHVDMGLGIYYPMGGFGAVARAFQRVGEDCGATYRFNASVTKIEYENGRATGVILDSGEHVVADVVIGNADYQHVEHDLLGEGQQSVRPSAWQQKVLSPSGLIICLGVNKRLPKLAHHNLFFDVDWDEHFDNVFTKKQWSEHPLFYLCAPSKTDGSVAPKGSENLFILAPQANGEQPSHEVLERTTDAIISRIEAKIGTSFAKNIVVRDIRAQDYFTETFNAYQGNAFGLAHTLFQSAPFRPPLRSGKLKGLYYVGQYTNPGTGVPMVVLSGKTVAETVRHDER